MRNTGRSLTFLAALLCASCRPLVRAPSPEAEEPVTALEAPRSSFLHTEDLRIVDEGGKTVVLRGCNAGAWLLIEPWIIGAEGQEGINSEKDLWDLMERRLGGDAKLDLIRTFREAFFTEADVQRIAELGLNGLRVPIWWRAVSDPGYGGDMAYLDRCIEWCERHGVYVILDLHGAPCSQSTGSVIVGEPADGGLWKDPACKARTVEWWTAVAARYRDNPVVAGYDLINEAYSAPVDDLMALYDELYRALRAVDPRHILIMEDGLHGFHRLPVPKDMGWENVVYSFHYYPQSRDEALEAAATVLPRFQRAAWHYGVPVFVGEFNSVFLDRGGVDTFRRYAEVFDYYGWSWAFWTYKKVEENRDALWGLVGYYDEQPTPDFNADDYENLRGALDRMATEHGEEQPLLAAALALPPRWRTAGAATDAWAGGRCVFDLRRAFPVPSDEGYARMEWGLCVPNIGYWKAGDTAVWRVSVPEDGVYRVGLDMANNTEGSVVRFRLDGVQAADADVENTHGWRAYREQVLGTIRLGVGDHVIGVEQGDANDSFVNMRSLFLERVADEAAPLEGANIVLTPFTARLDAGSPLRVEWLNDPPDIGYWRPGEAVRWIARTDLPAEYVVQASYSTVVSSSIFRLNIDGRAAASGTLPGTGAWHEFTTAEIGSVVLEPGVHTFEAVWEGEGPDGMGNLRHITLRAR